MKTNREQVEKILLKQLQLLQKECEKEYGAEYIAMMSGKMADIASVLIKD